jgi:hypothetical protein
MFRSLHALHKNGNYRTLQAIELESGVWWQWRLWKWASCASDYNIGQFIVQFQQLLQWALFVQN